MKKSIAHVACLVAVLFSPLSANSQSKELLDKALGGDVNAQYELGMVYFEGKGVSKNPDRAAGLFLMAAEQKHARAQNVLSVLNPDIIAKAQFNLGRMYEKGWGVTKDYKKAMEWYAKAAEQGYARAQYNLGVMYYNGWGVPKDYKKAMEWYTKAAGQGLAAAQNNIGSMYYNGWGVTRDYKKAMEWYTKAAGQGYAQPQYNIGAMYEKGPRRSSKLQEGHGMVYQSGWTRICPSSIQPWVDVRERMGSSQRRSTEQDRSVCLVEAE